MNFQTFNGFQRRKDRRRFPFLLPPHFRIPNPKFISDSASRISYELESVTVFGLQSFLFLDN